MRESLRNILGKRVLACDGAMGTELMARGMRPGECGELWNLNRPADVEAVHAAYIDAGCDLVMTNTFGATSTTLARHGLSRQVREINRAGAQIARAAAGDRAWVLGDIGPFGDFLEPAGDYTPAQLRDIFTEQLLGLNEGGVDGVIIETMVDPAEVAAVIQAARDISAWPIIATCTFSPQPDGLYRTIMGVSAAETVKRAIDAGAHVVGANCGTGMSLEDYAKLATQLVDAAGSTPVILQPNAGTPQQTDNGIRYLATPQDMANLAETLKQIGVKIIGGCCGTSPAHLQAIASTIHEHNPSDHR